MMLVACLDHQRDVDAAMDANDPCSVAGYQMCNACGRDHAYCQEITPRAYCVDEVCIPRTDGCSDSDYSCPDDRVCVHGIWIPRSPPIYGGQCVSESFCDQLEAAGHPMHCIWGDGTDRVTGAPADISSCPAPVASTTPFCGLPCGACASFTNTRTHEGAVDLWNDPACVGRSDTRQFGVCAVDAPCRRGELGADDICVWTFGGGRFPYYPELGLDCACVVFHDETTPDSLSDYGYATRADACDAYRDMYPGEVDCVTDRAWDRLPSP